MLQNKKGAALLQVLLVTAVLAGMATMLLRASLSRTTTARQTRRTVASQMLVQACQTEINALWSIKTPEAFARDMQKCWMTCTADPATNTACTTSNASRSYTCSAVTIGGISYTVTASFTEETPGPNGCELKYEITDNSTGSEVLL